MTKLAEENVSWVGLAKWSVHSNQLYHFYNLKISNDSGCQFQRVLLAF